MGPLIVGSHPWTLCHIMYRTRQLSTLLVMLEADEEVAHLEAGLQRVQVEVSLHTQELW